jgi:hypothetical protein
MALSGAAGAAVVPVWAQGGAQNANVVVGIAVWNAFSSCRLGTLQGLWGLAPIPGIVVTAVSGTHI